MKNSYIIEEVLKEYPALTFEQARQRLVYSSFVSLPRRYMFVQVPKAACTTMKTLIWGLEDSPPIDYTLDQVQTRREMFVHTRRNVAARSILDFDNDTQKEILESPTFFRFAVVRNPYSRIVSAWKSKVALCEPGFDYVYKELWGDVPDIFSNNFLSFAEFLDYVENSKPEDYNPHWMRQTDALLSKCITFSHIGKIERLADTISLFQKHLGSPALQIESHNTSVFRGAASLDAQQTARIYALYRDDFETFGYDRDYVSKPESSPATVDAKSAYSEILERNIIISMLARDRAALIARLRWSPAGILERIRTKLRGAAS